MEIIRNYLESMFSQLPNTPEVLKAKMELGQMMEDKYAELIAEGMAENEAIGVVISEFGNLDEIAEELGISRFIDPVQTYSRRDISLPEVRDYMNDVQQRAFFIALGVFFCIISVAGPIIGSGATGSGNLSTAMGVGFLFVSIAVGVGLIVFSSFMMKRWNFMNTEPCSIRMETMEYVRSRLDGTRISRALMMTIGVVLCIVSVVPVSMAGTFDVSDRLISFCAALIFVLVGTGVFLIVASNVRHSGFQRLLEINERGTIGAGYASDAIDGYRYDNESLSAVMSVYWPSVTCLYLIWSFLTFDWHITWIIWPIAAIVHRLIGYMFGEKQNGSHN